MLERIKNFLVVSILSECPEAPYVGISLKEVMRQQDLTRIGKDRELLQSLAGVSSETIERLNHNYYGHSRGRKLTSTDTSSGTEVITGQEEIGLVRKVTTKKLDSVELPSKQMWLDMVRKVDSKSLEIAREWDLSKVQGIVKSLRDTDEKRGIDKEANLAEINMNADVALMVRFVECANRKTFDYVDPTSSMTEGELLRALSTCVAYMSRFPEAINIGVLFNGIRKKVEEPS